MKFRLTDPKDDSDVMGGLLSEDNVYLTAYGVPQPVRIGDAMTFLRHTDLEVGQSIYLRFNLSGTSGTYRCTRVE